MRRAELVARVNQPIRGDYKIDLGTRQGGKHASPLAALMGAQVGNCP